MNVRPTTEHAVLAGAVLVWCALAAALLVPLSRRAAVQLGIMASAFNDGAHNTTDFTDFRIQLGAGDDCDGAILALDGG